MSQVKCMKNATICETKFTQNFLITAKTNLLKVLHIIIERKPIHYLASGLEIPLGKTEQNLEMNYSNNGTRPILDIAGMGAFFGAHFFQKKGHFACLTP